MSFNAETIIGEVVAATNAAMGLPVLDLNDKVIEPAFNFTVGTAAEVQEINIQGKKIPFVYFYSRITEREAQGNPPFDYEVSPLTVFFLYKTPSKGKQNAQNTKTSVSLTDNINAILKPYCQEFIRQLAKHAAIYPADGVKPFGIERVLYPKYEFEKKANTYTEILDVIQLTISDVRIKYDESNCLT